MFKQLNKNQKLALHFLFWVVYYVLFSFIWAKNGNYKDSFYLEFILLPIRILAVYLTIRYLIPQFLLKKKFTKFLLFYLLSIIVLGFMQQGFIHFFYNAQSETTISTNFNFSTLVRATILINSTTFFVSTIYILNLYFLQKENFEKVKIDKSEEALKIELKSNRKNYIISPSTIIYVEGMGNYVNYFIENGKKITVYQSLKECLKGLPNNFLRVHKSYIVNSKKIVYYNNESIEMADDKIIPIGSSFDIENLSIT